MKTITLIRHSRPEGEADPALSGEGKEWCRRISGSYEVIFLSPLRRCLDTYISSGLRGDRVEINDLLREQQDGKAYNCFLDETPIHQSRDDMMTRMTQFKAYLLSRPETNICCVSSAFAICYFQQACGLVSRPLGYLDTVVVTL